MRLLATRFALLLLAATLPAVAVAKPARALANCDVADLTVDSDERAFIQLLNDYRQRNGFAAVTLDTALVRAATWMSVDLAGRTGLDHVDSLGRSPWKRMADCGVAHAGGENLAAGSPLASPDAVFSAWKGSPDHNAIMLGKDFTHVGVARHTAPGSRYGVYWTLTFGYGSSAPLRVPSSPTPTASPPPPPTPTPGIAPPPAPGAGSARTLSVASGVTTITWNGDPLAIETAFAGARSAVRAVYAYDDRRSVWLRWSPTFYPELNTITHLQPGVHYWVVASGPITLPAR